jgi:hypothetical protein
MVDSRIKGGRYMLDVCRLLGEVQSSKDSSSGVVEVEPHVV